MKTFISYRHTGEKLEDLHRLLGGLCEMLKQRNIDPYCTLFNQDEFTTRELSAANIMKHVFEVINASDFLLVVLASEKKSEGMLMEVGYCIAKGIPVMVAVKQGVEDTYLPDMTPFVLYWKTVPDLVNQLKSYDFQQLSA